MHPSLTREIIRHREADLRTQARRDGMAKAARRAAKARRAAAAAAAAVPVPRVPDFADGAFQASGDRTHADA
jgi:hypothetical protein